MRNVNYKIIIFWKTLKKRVRRSEYVKGWKASSEWENKMRSSHKWKWKKKGNERASLV
jgi:hypothetical protein